MSDDNVVSIKDFFNQDARIMIIEHALTTIEKSFDSVDQRFHQIDKRFDKVDQRFDKLESKIDSQFKWMMGSFGCLALSTVSILLTLIFKLH